MYPVDSNIWLEVLLSQQRELKLDYDDAYQYVAAESIDATIVTFDADFANTPRGSQTPGEALARRSTP